MTLSSTLLYSHIRASGFEVSLLDLAFEDDYVAELEKDPPRAIFLSLSIDNQNLSLQIIKDVKARFPECLVFVGGPQATILGTKLFDLAPEINVIGIRDCIPECMKILEDAIKSPTVPLQCTISGQSADFGCGLLPDFKMWQLDRYFSVFPVEFSRGCRNRCPFCSEPVLRQSLHIKSVETMIEELRFLADRFEARFLRFVDPSFTSCGEAGLQLLEALIRENLQFQWGAYGYCNDITPKTAVLLRRAGCKALFLGIESLSSGVRSGKRCGRNRDSVNKALCLLRDNDISSHCNFIVGLPGETRESFEQTVLAIEGLQSDSVGGGPFFLTPESYFDRHPASAGIRILDPEWKAKQHTTFHKPDYEYFCTTTMGQAAMKELAQQFAGRISASEDIMWNMSDFVVLPWLSVGGTVNQLRTFWKIREENIHNGNTFVRSVLKEKCNVEHGPSQMRQYISNLKECATSV